MPSIRRSFYSIFAGLFFGLAPSTILWAQTQVKDSSSSNMQLQLQRHQDETLYWKRKLAQTNPVLLQQDSLAEWSSIGVHWQWSERNMYAPQHGSGSNSYHLNATSFKRLSTNQSIWGKAAYARGQKNNLIWNESSDIDRIYPYVIADSIGGDRQEETYQMEGGYNLQMGRQVIGGSIAYRATREYREVDPRPNNTVSDLTLRIGTTRDIGAYTMALSYDLNHYTQDNAVRIANPIAGVSFYHLIGMGMDQKLLWGRNSQAYFLGTSHQLALQYQPRLQEGWYVDFRAKKDYIDKSITTLKSLLSSFAKTKDASIQIAYQFKKDASYWAPFLQASSYQRKGTSFLFDNKNAVSDFVQIGASQDFEHERKNVQTGLRYQRPLFTKYSVGLRPTIGLHSERMAYRSDQRKWDIDQMRWGTSLYLKNEHHAKQRWKCEFAFTSYHRSNARFLSSIHLESNSLNQMVLTDYFYQQANRQIYSLDFEHHTVLSPSYTLRLYGNAIYEHFESNKKNYQTTIGIAILL